MTGGGTFGRCNECPLVQQKTQHRMTHMSFVQKRSIFKSNWHLLQDICVPFSMLTAKCIMGSVGLMLVECISAIVIISDEESAFLLPVPDDEEAG